MTVGLLRKPLAKNHKTKVEISLLKAQIFLSLITATCLPTPTPAAAEKLTLQRVILRYLVTA